MSKVVLRLIVVIAIVVVSVAITLAIVNKPNNNTTVYKTWQSASQDSRYDLNEKINSTISSNSTSFNGRTLKEIELKISNVANLGQAIEDYISYLAKFTKFSEDVKEKDAKNLKKLLSNYYDTMLNDDGTGYWVDYYYSYVENENFDAQNINVYNQLIQTIEAKWISQAQQGSNLISALEEYVDKYCFNKINHTDLKVTLLDFTAQFASVYVNSQNYSNFEVYHLMEFNNLLTNAGNKLSQISLLYTSSDLLLTENYSALTEQELSGFISSTNKSAYIQELANQGTVMQAKVNALNALLTYLGV